MSLQDLRRRGLIDPAPSDPSASDQWLDDAERHLAAARTIATIDPTGAYVLAYDAARKSVAAVLLARGFRVLSRPGSHAALAEFARLLADETGEDSLRAFDRMRRSRNRSEYGSVTLSQSEVGHAIEVASSIRNQCLKLMR